MIDPQDLEIIEQEGRRIIACGRKEPDAVVPQYPTWTLTDLALHVGGVHGRTAAVCRTLPQARIPTSVPTPGVDAFDWAEDQLDDMLAALASADPEAQVWTFVASPRLAFWGPRMVIETGVHRWDAQGAVGDTEPLPDIVATHGLDEFGALYLPRLGAVPAIELRATDLDRAWRFGGGGPVVIVEGTASDLYLRLMSRPGVALPQSWAQAVDALGSPAER